MWVPLVGEASELPKLVSMGHPALPSSGSSPVHFWGDLGWDPFPPGIEQPLPELGRLKAQTEALGR